MPPTRSLIRPLFDGPIDIVGDVHGEYEALRQLTDRLGYPNDGTHPGGRRLVFVGDLVDRGPDSVAVLDWVMPLIRDGRAQCVLGNHELNILRGRFGKPESRWFHGRGKPDPAMPQAALDPARRDDVLAFFASLPVALERDDLRIVHAAWDDASVEALRTETDALAAYRAFKRSLEAKLDAEGLPDDQARRLRLQNDNPVKMITSGPEVPAKETYELKGRVFADARARWWNDYAGQPRTVFGHYWRATAAGRDDESNPFRGIDPWAPLGPSGAMCIDYSVGGRYLHRAASNEPAGVLTAWSSPENRVTFETENSPGTIEMP